MGNTFKTAFLLTALTLLLMFFGRYFGGQNGMILALVFAAVMNFVSYFYSDKIALAMYSAQPVTREELPRAYAAVERLTQKIGIPMPKIYVIPTESPNAFATGRNPQHASVAVTHGILSLLTDEELEGVLAHELGHVNNRDILISSVAATIAGAITMLASMGRFAMIFGGFGGRPRRPPRRRIGRAVHADRRADCRELDSVGSVPFARIPGRCYGSTLHGQSLRAGERAAEDRRLCAACAAAGNSFDGAFVHHPAFPGNEFWESILDPSAGCQAHRAADGTAGGVYAIGQAFRCQPSAVSSAQEGIRACVLIQWRRKRKTGSSLCSE